MPAYRMSDGTIVRTENASINWREKTCSNGNNYISINTGSEWLHQKLNRSRKGRYYIEHMSDCYQGSTNRAEWISNEEAVRWLLLNEHEVPEELQDLVEQVAE